MIIVEVTIEKYRKHNIQTSRGVRRLGLGVSHVAMDETVSFRVDVRALVQRGTAAEGAAGAAGAAEAAEEAVVTFCDGPAVASSRPAKRRRRKQNKRAARKRGKTGAEGDGGSRERRNANATKKSVGIGQNALPNNGTALQKLLAMQSASGQGSGSSSEGAALK